MQAINTLSVKTFDVGPMLNIVYLIWDNKTKETAIVDPAWDLTEVLNFIDKKKLRLRKILLTHSHHDHVNSIDIILKKYDIPIYINKLEADFWSKEYDNLLTTNSNEKIILGSTEISSLHTPGHLLVHAATHLMAILLRVIHYSYLDVADAISMVVAQKRCINHLNV